MKLFIVLTGLFFTLVSAAPGQTVTFVSPDGLTVTADLYMTGNKKAPFIILYHQARYSRGEYLEIAPKLNTLGFNCLAVDQRSGDKVNHVPNETHARAVQKSLGTEYVDAFPDMEAALLYTKNKLDADKIIVWGSSYSSALVFVLASKYPDTADGILSFSPGNYFELEGKSVSDYAEAVDCPVFITSTRSEEESWRPVYDHLKTKNKTYYLPEDEGFHGSKALWEKNEGQEGYWKAVEEFLGEFK